MSLEKLLQKINEKEDVLIKQIEQETKQEIDKIISNFDSEIDAYSNFEWQKAKENIKALEQKEEINLDIFKRKMTLEIKRKILNDVYFAFIEKIKNLTLDEYKSWLLKNLNNLDFMNKQGELFIGTANFLENDTFSKEIIDYLSTKNLSSIKITFTQEIDFGFKYVENSVIIDFSLQSIISEIKQNTELKLSKILFN